MKIDAFHYVQLGTAYRSVSSEHYFLNAFICRLLYLSNHNSWCIWAFFFPFEQSTVLSGSSCFHLLQMLTRHIIAGSFFLKDFKPSVWEDLELFVILNNPADHVSV